MHGKNGLARNTCRLVDRGLNACSSMSFARAWSSSFLNCKVYWCSPDLFAEFPSTVEWLHRSRVVKVSSTCIANVESACSTGRLAGLGQKARSSLSFARVSSSFFWGSKLCVLVFSWSVFRGCRLQNDDCVRCTSINLFVMRIACLN